MKRILLTELMKKILRDAKRDEYKKDIKKEGVDALEKHLAIITRDHESKIVHLEADLYKVKKKLENAERGLQEVDYKKSNYKRMKKWNKDHEEEINICKKDVWRLESKIRVENSVFEKRKREMKEQIALKK